ncbi:Susd and RagB outer membrane lipoprotein [Chryseolinea serpens]|uniref:Susd and RagB outer membrane lipoprotein n=1 Tax=Chryseolinea serpens TaxID=947013 RepID=A0A1M5N7D3_9BACT|nr:SusD/RagB family nutrient-binding outer membrane lipoprotein [Chryseolinea serpens]SHG85387.1 Susd and RagB outer membrane lipoprotein [Chryseolinea serpens]
MKKKIFKKFRMPSAMLLGTLIGVMSCTTNFDDINTNKSAISNPGPAELPFLFSKAQSTATNSQWNYQVAQNLFSDQYAQYFACTATYFPSDRLFIRQDWVGAAFNPMYTDVMPQLQTLLTSYESTTAEYAIANVWWVYTFHKVTDYWGPIPYFKAGEIATSVDYDPQDKIYDDFFKRLEASIAVLKTASGTPYGDYDLLYGGKVDKWLKFANTLRLRLAMRVSKVDPDRAQTEAEQAVKDGVFETSPDDDALVQRSVKGSDGNGLSIMSDWNEFRMSASMESVLKGYDDPRISEYFLPALKTGTYEGARNGLTATQLGEAPNKPDALSHAGLRWSSYDVVDNKDYNGTNNKLSTKSHPGHLETPQNVMCTAEAYFIRAEGALLGWDMGGTAKELYEKGIQNSMYQWGINDNAAIAAYITGAGTPIAPGDYLSSPAMTNVPVAFGGTAAVQLEQIMTQKWLALFPDGMEGWADYRRSHVVKLYPVANSDNTDITNTSTQWIRRIPFLLTEKQSNAAGVATGEDLLGGPDNVLTPLWWDKN